MQASKFSSDKYQPLFCICSKEGQKFLTDTLGHISMTTDATSSIKETDLVVEAIVENLATKQKLFSNLDKTAPE